MRINESGRSMIEMLGVLAIIGVLSVGGIAGYTKAMNKYRTNKVIDQLTMIVTNIRTLYAMQRNYDGLDNDVAWNVGVIPDEMTSSVENAFGGAVTISESGKFASDDDKAFTVTFGGLTKEACVALATGDWGSGHSAGLIGVGANNGGQNATDTVSSLYLQADGSCPTSNATNCYINLPLSVVEASNECNCEAGSNSCVVSWKYF